MVASLWTGPNGGLLLVPTTTNLMLSEECCCDCCFEIDPLLTTLFATLTPSATSGCSCGPVVVQMDEITPTFGSTLYNETIGIGATRVWVGVTAACTKNIAAVFVEFPTESFACCHAFTWGCSDFGPGSEEDAGGQIFSQGALNETDEVVTRTPVNLLFNTVGASLVDDCCTTTDANMDVEITE